MSSRSVKIWLYASGTSLSPMKKAPTDIRNAAAIRGEIMRENDTPAAFIASSSLFSAICPTTIIEARSVARGRARGRIVKTPHIRNSRITPRPRPLPTSSSM